MYIYICVCVCIRDTHHPLWTSSNDDCSPHHCVGFLFFAWIPPGQPPPPPPPPPLHLHSSLTHHSLTHSCTHSLTHALTHSNTLSARGFLTAFLSAQYTEPPGGAAVAFRVAGAVHRASKRRCGARRRRWAAAAFRVAGAVRASWTSCGARGRRWAAAAFRVAGAVHRALLDEPRCAWPPLGRGCRLPFVWQAQYTEPPGGVGARVAPAGPGLPFVWQAQYPEPPGGAGLLDELRRAWPPLGRGYLSRGRRSTQSIHIIFDTLSFSHKFVSHHLSDTILDTPTLTHHLSHHFVPHHLSHTTLSHTILHKPLCHTLSFTHRFVTHHLSHFLTPSFTHHLSHTINTIFHTQLCHTPSFTHHFVTHYLSHTTLSHTIFHTPSVTHHLCQHFVTHHQHHLSHTIFDTPSFTHNFVTHYFSHTIFHTHLCHTPSLTHHLSHTALSHTIFHHTIFVTHHLSRRQLCHTPSFLHLFLCLSFLPRPRNNISCSLLEEVDLWGYPVLLFVISRYFPFLCPLSPASYIQKLSSASWFTPVGKRLIIPIKSRVGRVGPVLTRVMVILPTGLNQE